MTINKDILKKIDLLVIQHPTFNDIYEHLLQHIAIGKRGYPQLVVGPTGIGKTRLSKQLTESLYQSVKQYPELEFGPPLVIEGLAPEGGHFSWGTFYSRAISAMNEPGSNSKIDIQEKIIELQSGEKLSYKYLNTSKLRDIYQKVLAEKRPIAVIIDEAQHLGKAQHLEGKINNLDVIKSLANDGISPYILFGTYELREMLYVGAQLSRRVKVHNFRRYQKDDNSDRSAFRSAWFTICNEFGVPVHNDLNNEFKYLYNHSLGCIGVVVEWFRQATENAYKRQANSVSKKDLEATRLSNQQLKTMLLEIVDFESMHVEEDDFEPKNFLISHNQGNNQKKRKNRKTKGGRVGIRDPKRDIVGEGQNGQ